MIALLAVATLQPSSRAIAVGPIPRVTYRSYIHLRLRSSGYCGFEVLRRMTERIPADPSTCFSFSAPPRYRRGMADEPYVTKTGKVLTDADIEALADEAEEGFDLDSPQLAALTLRGLRQREAFWRSQLGDVDYERAVERWTRAVLDD